MSFTSDAADQTVEMTMDGIRFSCRLAGNNAHRVFHLLQSALNDPEASRGLSDIRYLLSSGCPLKIYTLRSEDLEAFADLAASRHLIYCTLRSRQQADEPWDIIFFEKDDSIVCRIFQQLDIEPITPETQPYTSTIKTPQENPSKAPPGSASRFVPISQLYREGEAKSAEETRRESVREALERLRRTVYLSNEPTQRQPLSPSDHQHHVS